MESVVTDEWGRVATALVDRIAELGLTKAEVIRRSGVSDKSLDGYLNGQPIVRKDKRRGLCEALVWSGDSIERLLNGEPPEVIDRGAGTVDALLDGFGRLLDRLEELVVRQEQAHRDAP